MVAININTHRHGRIFFHFIYLQCDNIVWWLTMFYFVFHYYSFSLCVCAFVDSATTQSAIKKMAMLLLWCFFYKEFSNQHFIRFNVHYSQTHTHKQIRQTDMIISKKWQGEKKVNSTNEGKAKSKCNNKCTMQIA